VWHHLCRKWQKTHHRWGVLAKYHLAPSHMVCKGCALATSASTLSPSPAIPASYSSAPTAVLETCTGDLDRLDWGHMEIVVCGRWRGECHCGHLLHYGCLIHRQLLNRSCDLRRDSGTCVGCVRLAQCADARGGGCRRVCDGCRIIIGATVIGIVVG
jgi:hypothetical protein